MLQRQVITGGWYGEALTDGSMAVTRILPDGADVLTHHGSWATPGDVSLFTRCGRPGGAFEAAGQSWVGKGTIVSQGGSWRVAGPSCGVSPHIYAPDLVINENCRAGTQGFRQVSDLGQVLSGDATYRDASRTLWEYSTMGDLTVGQGEHGAVALYQGKRLVLEPGDCRWIRLNRSGDTIAITIVKQPEHVTVILRGQVQDLMDYPIDVIDGQVPAPPPKQEPPHIMPANREDVVRSIRAKYPTPLGDQADEFLSEVARATGAKLLRKDAGNHIVLHNGTPVSADILMFGDQGVDVLGDSEGAATPGWMEKGSIPGTYVEPDQAADPGPAPAPGPDPGPAGPGLSINEQILHVLVLLTQHLGVR